MEYGPAWISIGPSSQTRMLYVTHFRGSQMATYEMRPRLLLQQSDGDVSEILTSRVWPITFANLLQIEVPVILITAVKI